MSYVPVQSSLLLYESYANESPQICPFLAGRPQFESVHHQNRRLSSHSYSHESVICFVVLGLICVSYGEFAFFELKCTRLGSCRRPAAVETGTAGHDRGQQVVHNGL